ncbi:hypothetical protein LEN26_019058 [Aphanomyces euteiches]|nr:hypothetical protein LEN26_019058 [Aphanomyces euteiches]KAH9126267.1 hypothetical protein AeMF1_003293 [Aphanomyces euteiches]KAH9190922.1 hypothetical protein AeNC1_007103 [Aphanomyces euteiches]
MKFIALLSIASVVAQAPAPCTQKQAGVVVAAVNASTNLAECTKDSGFNWLTFFTTDAIPTDAQATASLASMSCLALVGEANGLKLQPCQLWNNDLSKLVTQDPVAWIKAKSSAVSKSTSSTAAPSSSSNSTTTTTSAPTTTPKSSASGVVAGLAAIVIALVMP